MTEVKRPGLALCIYATIGYMLFRFGITQGSLLILDAVLGLIFYKGITGRR